MSIFVFGFIGALKWSEDCMIRRGTIGDTQCRLGPQSCGASSFFTFLMLFVLSLMTFSEIWVTCLFDETLIRLASLS